VGADQRGGDGVLADFEGVSGEASEEERPVFRQEYLCEFSAVKGGVVNMEQV
jgi:hypothetical protein